MRSQVTVGGEGRRESSGGGGGGGTGVLILGFKKITKTKLIRSVVGNKKKN
jgi:hypothetical protein